tara:strand:+ start:1575 stop:2942 length:1368 start_codon:yes stop_codon:yes gene_type:complete
MVKRLFFLKSAFQRFRYAAIFSVCWTISACLVEICDPILNHFSGACVEFVPYFDLLAKTFTLGIPMFITFQLVSEKYNFNFPKVLMLIFGGICLFLYFLDGFIFDKSVVDNVYFQQQFYLYFLILSLFLSFASFFKTSMHSFWKFNNILFIKLIQIIFWCFIYIVIYFFCIYIIDFLLVQDLSFSIYKLGMIIIFGYVGSLYFLTQIPTNLDSLEEHTPYPKFYYYISSLYFLPASILFIAFSYSFFGAMLFLGWSFNIIITIFTLLGVGFGLFFLIQMELLRTRTSNKVTLFFLKYFYWFILPVVVVNLFFLSQEWLMNGVVEFWYVCWLLLLWVVIVCLYFIFSKFKDIRLIPMSLFILSIIIATDPFMPFNVACKSQLFLLEKTLEEDNILQNGKISFETTLTISELNESKVKNIITYLDEHNRLRLLKKLYPYTIASESLTTRRLYYDFNL